MLVTSAVAHARDPDGPTLPLTPNHPSPTMDAPDVPSAQTGLPDTREGDSSGRDDDQKTPYEWLAKYEEARERLLKGEFADAAVRFAELEKLAVNRTDRATARAQRTLADEWAAKNLVLTTSPSASLSGSSSDKQQPAPKPLIDRRSTDELAFLYVNSIVYGIGSGVWLGTLTKPETAATALLPATALTAGSVGVVIALDNAHPHGFRYGVPQSIVSGMYIGLEHGIVWAAFRDSLHNAGGSLRTQALSTLLWSTTTAGAVLGGVLSEYAIDTTPGRSAWTGSVALWGATMVGLGVGGITGKTSESLATGGVALSAFTGVGMLTAGSVSPSISRVRLIDLAGGLGLATGFLVYVGVASSSRHGSDGQAAAGVASLGALSGLAIGWVATSGIPNDPLREPKRGSSSVNEVRPMLWPVGSGAMIGAVGSLD